MSSTKPHKPVSAFAAPVEISETLAAVVGHGPMPRTEITKKLWDYIKKHKLQNPNAKKEIMPDEKLGKVLGSTATIDMFAMTKKVAAHIKK